MLDEGGEEDPQIPPTQKCESSDDDRPLQNLTQALSPIPSPKAKPDPKPAAPAAKPKSKAKPKADRKPAAPIAKAKSKEPPEPPKDGRQRKPPMESEIIPRDSRRRPPRRRPQRARQWKRWSGKVSDLPSVLPAS
eukprot:jgi/Tetstr1/436718/TSEL_025501.t1